MIDKVEDVCPITDVKFNKSVDELWRYEARSAPGGSILISRNVMQHGIERLTVAPSQPCLDHFRYNAAPNQQFWFAEMRRVFRDCPTLSTSYQEVPDSPALTEWDV